MEYELDEHAGSGLIGLNTRMNIVEKQRILGEENLLNVGLEKKRSGFTSLAMGLDVVAEQRLAGDVNAIVHDLDSDLEEDEKMVGFKEMTYKASLVNCLFRTGACGLVYSPLMMGIMHMHRPVPMHMYFKMLSEQSVGNGTVSQQPMTESEQHHHLEDGTASANHVVARYGS